jgi:hypothetical protein
MLISMTPLFFLKEGPGELNEGDSKLPLTPSLRKRGGILGQTCLPTIDRQACLPTGKFAKLKNFTHS